MLAELGSPGITIERQLLRKPPLKLDTSVAIADPKQTPTMEVSEWSLKFPQLEDRQGISPDCSNRTELSEPAQQVSDRIIEEAKVAAMVCLPRITGSIT